MEEEISNPSGGSETDKITGTDLVNNIININIISTTVTLSLQFLMVRVQEVGMEVEEEDGEEVEVEDGEEEVVDGEEEEEDGEEVEEEGKEVVVEVGVEVEEVITMDGTEVMVDTVITQGMSHLKDIFTLQCWRIPGLTWSSINSSINMIITMIMTMTVAMSSALTLTTAVLVLACQSQ